MERVLSLALSCTPIRSGLGTAQWTCLLYVLQFENTSLVDFDKLQGVQDICVLSRGS
jgi:hypothetical protein